MDLKQEISKMGLTYEQYESCLNDILNKMNGIVDLEWEEIRSKYNLPITADCLRKSQSKPFGGSSVVEYYKNKKPIDNLDLKLEQIRKEKIKLQTLNTERNRLDRAEARQTLFYEQVGDYIKALSWPKFQPLHFNENSGLHYVLTLADFHYGAEFNSQNNSYSREICKERLEYLIVEIENFVNKHQINELTVVSLGDDIQNILRLSDLKINDTTIVKCVVEISHLIAQFLNEISAFVNVEYYHTPYANHTQVRVLGAKANELGDEDLEYIISHYIQDLLANNDRVHVNLAYENEKVIRLNIPGNSIIAMHGHGIKNYSTALKDISNWLGSSIDYLLLGHLHSGQEIPNNENCTLDTEILVSPSFCGSDLYADSLFKGNKAAVKIYGFDEIYGHTESYKIILN